MKDHDRTILFFAIAMTLFLLIGLLFASCSPKVITEIHTQYVHDTTTLHDSIFRDRIVKEYHKGDTIYLKDSVFVYKYKYLDKVKEVIVRDSIPYAVEVEKIVKKRSAYDKFCSRFFWITLVAVLLVIAGWILDKIYNWTGWLKLFFKR